MPAHHDFFVRTSPEHVRAEVAHALVDAGYTVHDDGLGGLRASRGSLPLTVLLGGLASDGGLTTLTVELMVAADGQTVARLLRGTGLAAVRGGVIGIARRNRAFERTADAVRTRLAATGALTAGVQR